MKPTTKKDYRGYKVQPYKKISVRPDTHSRLMAKVSYPLKLIDLLEKISLLPDRKFKQLTK